MTVYISPIGYDSTRVTRPILSRGLDSDDHVILLLPHTGKDDQRSAEAVDDIRRLLQEIEPDVSLSEEYLPYNDLQQAVFDCIEVIQSVDDEIVANFGGGARDVFLAFTISVLNNSNAVTSIIRFSDIDGQVAQIQFPDLTINVPETGRQILQALVESNSAATLPEINDMVGASKSTITRHVANLEEQGAVEAEMHGKTKHVELTFTGKLYVTRTETVG